MPSFIFTIFLGLILCLPVTHAAAPDLSLRSTFEVSTESLSTAKMWDVEPEEFNPHLRTWGLKRDVHWVGLSVDESVSKPRKGAPLVYRVKIEGLRADTKLYLRPSGPWYRTEAEFSCATRPDDWFATAEGAKIAGQFAAKSWDQILSANKLKLGLLLQKVSAASAALALVRADQIFQQWLQEIESQWQRRGLIQARAQEWSYYKNTAPISEYCKVGKHRQMTPPPSEARMEPPAENVPQSFLARAPARRWSGFYSVRLSVALGDKTLNGQFLIDASAAKSFFSPSWLQAQGLNPSLLERTDVRTRRLSWQGGSGIAVPARLLGVKLSGTSVPLQEIYLMEAEIFSPPEYLTQCCDGVLGVDFLRFFALEFLPGPPTAVKLWDRRAYRPSSSFKWVALSLSEEGKVLGQEMTKVMQGSGAFSIDLANGRLWLGPDENATVRLQNRSGLTLQFDFTKEQERELRVVSIEGWARSLQKQGLKVGSVVTAVDGKPAEEMDAWEVEQHLAGVYGDIVILQWRASAKMLKLAPLRVR